MTARLADGFLADIDASEIAWSRPAGSPTALSTQYVLIGNGTDALEVAVATAQAMPKINDVRSLWKVRWGQRAAPVLLVVAYDDHGTLRAHVCGTRDDPAVLTALDLRHLERVCAAALREPEPMAADRTLQRLLVGQRDQLIAGLTNQGLFASHELRHGVPRRNDWVAAQTAGASLLGKNGLDLIRGLGYTASPLGTTAQILAVEETRHAVAVLLNDGELFDRPADRFGAASPVAQGLKIAKDQGVPWLMVTKGTEVRLYPARPDVGVGRKGQAETWAGLDLAVLPEAEAAYLPLLFGAGALVEDGSVARILADSADHAAALGQRLRDRVYVDVIPRLAVAVARRMNATSAEELREAYHRTLTILFRLLFVAYAEDRGLLPYQRNPRYTRKALKTLAREFTEAPNMPFDADATDRWDDLEAVWRAIDDGNTEWSVPAYNGGLFTDTSSTGRAISGLRLTNAEIGPALQALLVDTGDDGTIGPVDFRALSVREFGTLYEGLLESSLSIAPADLTLGADGVYTNATPGDTVVVSAGAIYFHNASGQRKSTGSYFTKSFAVEHLLDTALEPTLTEHLDRVNALLIAGDDAAAAESFFDFRVADLAMGSGHFLVAAIDRLENQLSAFLTTHPLPTITDELNRLATVAAAALGANNLDIEVETSALLRRQIARRCIYGLDLNEMAVELARLGIWIHTFVPGLPMSTLDHGLVVGNSLTGIGTIGEALDAYEPRSVNSNQPSLMEEQIVGALGDARAALLRVARTTEATKSEVHAAAAARAQAMYEAADARALLDAALAIRWGMSAIPASPESAIRLGNREDVQTEVAKYDAAHLPYLFPEVFVRECPGFDVVVGNPPWDEVMIEEPKFWQRYAPGVMGLNPAGQKQRIKQLRQARPDLLDELEVEQGVMSELRRVLMSGPYPGLTKGDIDFYKAFSWRDWSTLRSGGRMGVVFPRSLLNAAGSGSWRQTVLTQGQVSSAVTLTNARQWVFEDVHPQYTVVLLTVTKTKPEENQTVGMAGPFHTLQDFSTQAEDLGQMPVASLTGWGTGAAFPLLPSTETAETFAKYRQHPRFDDKTVGWDLRPVAEFHATNDRMTFDAGGETPDRWPVYTGATFNLWDPDAGDPYTWADATTVTNALATKRRRQARTSSSAFYGMAPALLNDSATLPCMGPRIAFRDVTNRTNTRTCVTALIPGQSVVTNKAPYLLRRAGTPADESYVLGVLSSIPLDWYTRRYVELSMSVDLFRSLPVPNPPREHPLRLRVVELSGRLAAVDARYTGWAETVGVPVGSISSDAAKWDAITELDAVVALLYGLDRSDVEHIFATFHRGWDYRPRLDAVLGHYDSWKDTPR